jgi:hypothetical protein
MTRNVQKLFYFTFLLFLLSCSEDDSDINSGPSEPVEPTNLSGVFIDSKVTGLNYSTETKNGVTNSRGEFNYIEGEMVTFSVGQISLGTAPGSPVMSPVTIASTADASVETQEVKNIAAFLQTLDSDNDSSNGILIETATVEAISVDNIDFTQSIISILGEIVAEVNMANDTNLSVVYPETAAEHLAGTLGETYEIDDPVFNNFIPFIEHNYGVNLSSFYWIHKIDDEGKLMQSTQYEKYPHRAVFVIRYLDYNDKSLPTSLERFPFDTMGNEETVGMDAEIFYSETGIIEQSIIKHHESPNWNNIRYIQFDDEGRVIELEYSVGTYDMESTTRVINAFDEKGNRIETNNFNIEDGQISSKVIYTYTEWGDKASEILYNSSGNEVARYENYYREDRTLEKQVVTGINGTNTILYDENEKPI